MDLMANKTNVMSMICVVIVETSFSKVDLMEMMST